jgi:hypothetical protein
MPRLALTCLALGFLVMPASALAPSTRPGDLTIVQTVVRARGGRAARIRRHIARPRALPRAVTRQVTSSLVVVAGAGEVEPNTFVVSVAIINRLSVPGPALAAGGRDLEDRVAHAALGRLTGVHGKRKSVTQERAGDILSATPSPSFCGLLPPMLVSALTSPALHVEAAPIVPWTPGQLLRNSLGLAFRACGLPLPAQLVAEDVDRFAGDITRPAGATTTTTLPEECDGTAQLDTMTLTDPAYPACTDVEWVTPIPGCADDIVFDVIDVATGQPIEPVLFGHTTYSGYFIGSPLRFVLKACNGAPGSPGGETKMLYAVVTWGG